MWKSLRGYLLTGIFVVLPITITMWLVLWLIKTLGRPVAALVFYPIFESFNGSWINSPVGKALMDLSAVFVVLIFITIIGYFSQFVLGKFTIDFFEKFVAKIPFASSVYKTVKQIVDTFSKKKKNVFQKAVLIEFPRANVYTVGFLTGTVCGEAGEKLGAKYYNVFVPTTPNPTSGFLMLLKEEDVKPLEMSVGDAMKYIVSFGAVVSASDIDEAKKIAENAVGE